jgi:hypothetical protein
MAGPKKEKILYTPPKDFLKMPNRAYIHWAIKKY